MSERDQDGAVGITNELFFGPGSRPPTDLLVIRYRGSYYAYAEASFSKRRLNQPQPIILPDGWPPIGWKFASSMPLPKAPTIAAVLGWLDFNIHSRGPLSLSARLPKSNFAFVVQNASLAVGYLEELGLLTKAVSLPRWRRCSSLEAMTALRRARRAIGNPRPANREGPYAPGCFRFAENDQGGFGPKQWKMLQALWDETAGYPKPAVTGDELRRAIYGRERKKSDTFRKLVGDLNGTLNRLGFRCQVEQLGRGSDTYRLARLG